MKKLKAISLAGLLLVPMLQASELETQKQEKRMFSESTVKYAKYALNGTLCIAAGLAAGAFLGWMLENTAAVKAGAQVAQETAKNLANSATKFDAKSHTDVLVHGEPAHINMPEAKELSQKPTEILKNTAGLLAGLATSAVESAQGAVDRVANTLGNMVTQKQAEVAAPASVVEAPVAQVQAVQAPVVAPVVIAPTPVKETKEERLARLAEKQAERATKNRIAQVKAGNDNHLMKPQSKLSEGHWLRYLPAQKSQ